MIEFEDTVRSAGFEDILLGFYSTCKATQKSQLHLTYIQDI